MLIPQIPKRRLSQRGPFHAQSDRDLQQGYIHFTDFVEVVNRLTIGY